MEKSELGAEVSSVHVCGHYNIKEFENGIRLKLYGQPEVFLSHEDVKILGMDLLYLDKLMQR